MRQELDPNRQQLVTDLAADYSEKIVTGKEVSLQEYLDKLPDDASRKAFKILANITRFVATIETIKQEDAVADEEINTRLPGLHSFSARVSGPGKIG